MFIEQANKIMRLGFLWGFGTLIVFSQRPFLFKGVMGFCEVLTLRTGEWKSMWRGEFGECAEGQADGDSEWVFSFRWVSYQAA